MEQRLAEAAQEGDINALYAALRQDPNVLEGIDKFPFKDTPLHIAASAGHTLFALEMLRLKPSFGRKLNPDGLSPLDLALRNGHTQTARRLANYEPRLIRVQGREGMTPLHYVAGTGEPDLLAEFLLTCPASIEDSTIRADTAVHIAVRNERFSAFKVLLGWLQRADKVEILNWRNEDGNTVLHIAAITDQTEVMKLLVKKVQVNDKNFEGLTALDIILRSHPGEENATAKKLLAKARGSEASSLRKLGTLADFLSTRESTKEKLIGLDVYRSRGLSGEMRNAILVVAVLIATATFQAVLQPPGGVAQANSIPITSTANTNATATATTNNAISDKGDSPNDNDPGKTVMSEVHFYQFIFWNSITFAASVGIIYMLLPPNRYIFGLFMSLFFLMLDYINSAIVITPSDTYGRVIIYLGFAIFALFAHLARPRGMPRKGTAFRRMTGSSSFHNRCEMEKFFSLCKYGS